MSKRLSRRLLVVVLPPLVAGYLHLVRLTTRFAWTIPEEVRDIWDRGAPAIYAFWHRDQALACCVAKRFRTAILISRSFDGELIARTATYFSLLPVRGSSSRGGAGALRQMRRTLEAGRSVSVTPDGPRGPLGAVHPGVVRLARETGLPLVPVAIATSRQVEASSWDRFVVPLPFARGALAIAPPMRVPANADEGAFAGMLSETLRQLNVDVHRAVGRQLNL